MEEKIKVLLLGYNGANNTGSEARLISIINDIKVILKDNVVITVPTLNKTNLERYIKENDSLKIVPIHSIFFFDIRKLVKNHDIVLLVEGSCYMDTWTSSLLWAFLWTTRCAKKFNKPCIAYAVDTGHLSSFNQWLVKREASKTDLIITRTGISAEKLKKIGVKASIEITADCAFNFKIPKKNVNSLEEKWSQSGSGVVGLAIVDFYLWPVVFRPFGRDENLYKWPYYFSKSKERIKRKEELASEWVKKIDRLIEKHEKKIALICMEELDEPFAIEIKNKVKNTDMVKIFSSRNHNAIEMVNILRNLDLLVTSRYHAGVLSLEAEIPQIAIGHDTRLKNFYKEMNLENYFLDYMDPKMWDTLDEKIDKIFENPKIQQKILKNGFIQHFNRAKKNPKILKDFLQKKGFIE